MYMHVEALQSSLMKGAVALRNSGLKADIPGSEAVFTHTREKWLAGQNDPESEYNWRCAGLIHGALLVRDGKFQQAADAYNPALAVGGYVPPTAEICLMFKAMMAVGRLYARHMQSGGGDVATTAELLSDIPGDRFNPWRGFVELLLIELYEKTGSHRDADLALSLLDAERQPDLYAIAQHKAGQGKGRVRRGLFGTRPAAYQPEECLYYFNER